MGNLINYLPVLVWGGFGIYLVYKGIDKYKNARAQRDHRFTQKSVEEFSRKFGILLAILGVLLMFGAFSKIVLLPGICTLINTGLMLADGIGLILVYKKVLKPIK